MPASWSKVYINGSGWYVDGDKVWLPMGVTISYRALDLTGASTAGRPRRSIARLWCRSAGSPSGCRPGSGCMSTAWAGSRTATMIDVKPIITYSLPAD